MTGKQEDLLTVRDADLPESRALAEADAALGADQRFLAERRARPAQPAEQLADQVAAVISGADVDALAREAKEAEAIERRLPLQKAVVAERRRLAAIAVDRVGEQVREAVRPLHAAALRSVGLAAAALLSGVDQVEAILTDVEGRGFSITGLPNVIPPGLRESIEMALLETLEVGAIEASDVPRGVAREIVALGVARRAEARDRAKAPPKPAAPRPPEKVATAGSAWSHIGRIPGRRL